MECKSIISTKGLFEMNNSTSLFKNTKRYSLPHSTVSSKNNFYYKKEKPKAKKTYNINQIDPKKEINILYSKNPFAINNNSKIIKYYYNLSKYPIEINKIDGVEQKQLHKKGKLNIDMNSNKVIRNSEKNNSKNKSKNYSKEKIKVEINSTFSSKLNNNKKVSQKKINDKNNKKSVINNKIILDDDNKNHKTEYFISQKRKKNNDKNNIFNKIIDINIRLKKNHGTMSPKNFKEPQTSRSIDFIENSKQIKKNTPRTITRISKIIESIENDSKCESNESSNKQNISSEKEEDIRDYINLDEDQYNEEYFDNNRNIRNQAIEEVEESKEESEIRFRYSKVFNNDKKETHKKQKSKIKIYKNNQKNKKKEKETFYKKICFNNNDQEIQEPENQDELKLLLFGRSRNNEIINSYINKKEDNYANDDSVSFGKNKENLSSNEILLNNRTITIFNNNYYVTNIIKTKENNTVSNFFNYGCYSKNDYKKQQKIKYNTDNLIQKAKKKLKNYILTKPKLSQGSNNNRDIKVKNQLKNKINLNVYKENKYNSNIGKKNHSYKQLISNRGRRKNRSENNNKYYKIIDENSLSSITNDLKIKDKGQYNHTTRIIQNYIENDNSFQQNKNDPIFYKTIGSNLKYFNLNVKKIDNYANLLRNKNSQVDTCFSSNNFKNNKLSNNNCNTNKIEFTIDTVKKVYLTSSSENNKQKTKPKNIKIKQISKKIK